MLNEQESVVMTGHMRMMRLRVLQSAVTALFSSLNEFSINVHGSL